MFNRNIEKKVVDFIKKNPIGATSSEIARFLGVNRVTLTKYLAVIREKAKIDFKNLGMAKVWYIPIGINKVNFLTKMLAEVCIHTDQKNAKQILDESSSKIGKEILSMYKKFYGSNKLSKNESINSIIDIMNKLGGEFSLVEQDTDRIVFRNSKCLFGKEIKKCPLLCGATLKIIEIMVNDNLGYGRVELKKSLAEENEDLIVVHLKS